MNTVEKPVKHSAPGQYLGFALQPVRLCYHLLTCERGASVSLEYLDDVAIHHADGSTTLEQTKSALKQNPLSDWADDFWKALANWSSLNDIAGDEIKYRLYVTPVRTGDLAEAMSAANDSNGVETIIDKLRKALALLKKVPGCQEYLQKFLDTEPKRQSKIIIGLTVESVDNDPVDPIRSLITTAVSPMLLDIMCQTAIGMAKEQADRMIRAGKPAILNGDSFKAAFRNFIQKNNLPGFFISFTKDPAEGEIATVLSTRPTFIQQLEIIGVEDADRVRAVSDFLRASADKTTWAEAGLIFEENLTEWDSDLVRRHGFIAGEISDLHGKKDGKVRGRLIYRRCAQLQPPLDGRVVPGHFIHGCFNALADQKRLGWHPNFSDLLEESDE